MLSRPQQHLIELTHRYPQLGQQVDNLREQRGKNMPDWPEWCFLPMVAFYPLACARYHSASLSLAAVADLAVLSALAAWRVSQGIYRFDADVRAALVATPITGALPVDVLYRLPEWCVYIETADPLHGGRDLHGFFAHLEHDARNQRAELRLLLDTDNGLLPLPIHLQPGTLADSLQAVLIETRRHDYLLKANRAMPTAQRLNRLAEPAVSLLLYLCSTAAEIVDTAGTNRQPFHPAPKQTKQGTRFFPPHEPTVWQVAYRLGSTLRQADRPSGTDGEGGHTHPGPPIGSSRWQAFWTGPKDAPDRKLEVRWLPPAPVGVQDTEQLTPGFHRVN